MLFLLTLVVSLIVSSFIGHVVHWSLHQPWSGPAYRGHMEHHRSLYPPGHLTSDRYRSPRWYNSGTFLFTPPAIAVLWAAWGLLHRLGAPPWVAITFGATLLVFSLINDWAHDSYHVRRNRLLRFGWYRRLRRLHYLHHHDMSKNLGIITLVWDRVFGTFVTKL